MAVSETGAQVSGRDQTEALEEIKAIVGPKGWIDDAEELEPHLIDFRRRFRGETRLLVRPKSTAEVADVVRVAAAAGIEIVPQGGNTGMCGGAIPSVSGEQIILSLQRMDRIIEIDPTNHTMTVEAGCILQTLQEAASDADRYFPLSLGAQGSCTIGGNLSTNAGGVNVVKFGNARELVLGIEAVLPDGRVWNGLKGLRKDNTGYDLKHLFMGAEGTLGIITGAVLKLFPKPRDTRAAFCAMRDLPAAIELLGRARAETGDSVETFEYLPRSVIDLVLRHIPGIVDPLETQYAHYVMMEVSTTSSSDDGLGDRLEALLGEAMEDGLIIDAAISQNEAHRQAFWRIRESIPEAQRTDGMVIAHDVSVPISRIPELYEAGRKAIAEVFTEGEVMGFGHLGDGNLHFNVQVSADVPRETVLASYDAVNHAVHDQVALFNGSISAEHGIGTLKRDELHHYEDPLKLELMARIKQALDPDGIMNPGKVI